MAIFDKENSVAGPGTVVGANVKLTGVLKDTNDITVHGKVEGEVISDHNVQITETAEVKGPISAQNIVVAGKVDGAINAAQKIEILPTGKIFGSISMKDLIIRSGAVFIGKSMMPDKKSDFPQAVAGALKSEERADNNVKSSKSNERAKAPAYEIED